MPYKPNSGGKATKADAPGSRVLAARDAARAKQYMGAARHMESMQRRDRAAGDTEHLGYLQDQMRKFARFMPDRAGGLPRPNLPAAPR